MKSEYRKQTCSLLGLLGLAIRARRVRGGATASKAALRSGQACLILLAGDCAQSTRRLFTRLSKVYGVPLIVRHTRQEYGACLNGAPRAVLAVLDRHFAAGMLAKTGGDRPRKARRS